MSSVVASVALRRPLPWAPGAAVALALASVACGGAARARPAAGPAPDATTAIAETRGLAREIEMTLGRGEATDLAPLCAIDLVALGPRATDGGQPRTETLIELDDALPAKRHRLKVRDQRIDIAPGARSAWLTQQVDVDGKRHAVTAIASEVDGLWVVTAVMVGAAVPERTLRDQAPGSLPRLAARAAMPRQLAGNQRAPAEPLAAFALAAGDVEARLGQLNVARAVVLGPGERAWHGDKDIRKAWRKDAPRWTLRGNVQAGATPDGELVWIASNASTIDDGKRGRPRRLFAVYRRADRDPPPVPPPAKKRKRRAAVEEPAPPATIGPPPTWRLVVLHEAVAR